MAEIPKKPAHGDLVDDSPTDELPVLTELDVVDDPSATLRVAALGEDTARHATVRIAVGGGADDDTSKLALALHEQRRMLADKDATIASLEERLSATLEAVARRDRNEAALRAELERSKEQIEALDADGALARQRADELERKAAELEQKAAKQAQAAAELAAKLEAAEREIAETRRSEQELVEWIEGEEKAREGLAAELEQSRRRIAELESRANDSSGGRAEAAAKAKAEAAAALAALRAQAEAVATDLEQANARGASLAAERDAAAAKADSLAAERDAAAAKAASLAAELDAAKRRAEWLEKELAAARAAGAEPRTKLEAAGPSAAPHDAAGRADAGDRDALARARQEAAALAAYIENRRAHWQDMEASLAEKDAQIEALRRELEQRLRRQHEAERTAKIDRERAKELQRELVELRREAEQRADIGSVAAGRGGELLLAVDQGGQSLESKLERERAEFERECERLASELERERLDLEALRAAAAAKDDELARLAERQAALERMLDESKKQLADAVASAARFERLALEQAVLPRTDGGRSAASDGADTASRRESLAVATSHSGRSLRPAFERRTTPVLVCLTGEAPRSYRLAKEAVTIGRGAHCEIQIATHFVSREHARLEVGPERVEIVDLGSKNGVFVNSVRVARETLRHGDLVTVGETQFRFLAE